MTLAPKPISDLTEPFSRKSFIFSTPILLIQDNLLKWFLFFFIVFCTIIFTTTIFFPFKSNESSKLGSSIILTFGLKKFITYLKSNLNMKILSQYISGNIWVVENRSAVFLSSRRACSEWPVSWRSPVGFEWAHCYWAGAGSHIHRPLSNTQHSTISSSVI